MNGTSRHIDRLDFLRRSPAQCPVIAVTNSEVIAHHTAHARQPKAYRARPFARTIRQMQCKHPVDNREMDKPWAFMPLFDSPQGPEQIILDQIAQCHFALFLDILIARDDGRFIKRNAFDPVIFAVGHCVALLAQPYTILQLRNEGVAKSSPLSTGSAMKMSRFTACQHARAVA